MNWDYSFFISKNNLFSKQGVNQDQENTRTRVVTEVNRVKLCSKCGRYVGEVCGVYYEIDQKSYCAPCGFKQITQKPKREEHRKPLQKQLPTTV
jgi:hypothetical protein